MKYQQLENLESGWKWAYLVKKMRAGENVTRYTELSEMNALYELLLQAEHQPEQINTWIQANLHAAYDTKLKQVVRATRKRYFNAEKEHTRKKSIDLEYLVWEKLSQRAELLGMTLSGTITHLLEESVSKNRYESQIMAARSDLADLLKK
ncbi:MAG: macrodomain Ter protein MatP [Plesiomonas sp.]|uniref:macrodomain Ter protein MatP n=1 Tax=Plesiomonas sp. TaxID=2486279 RepID=UPI003EE7DB2C